MSKESKEKKVKIRVLPLRGIGGIGPSGTEAMVTKAEADKWVADGYAEIVMEDPEVVPSSAAGNVTDEGESPDGDHTEGGSHQIMMPESRR